MEQTRSCDRAAADVLTVAVARLGPDHPDTARLRAAAKDPHAISKADIELAVRLVPDLAQ